MANFPNLWEIYVVCLRIPTVCPKLHIKPPYQGVPVGTAQQELDVGGQALCLVFHSAEGKTGVLVLFYTQLTDKIHIRHFGEIARSGAIVTVRQTDEVGVSRMRRCAGSRINIFLSLIFIAGQL